MPPPQQRDENRSGGDWIEYKMLVLQKLEDGKGEQEKINEKLDRIEDDVTNLKIRAGIWGAAMGFVGASIPLAIDVFLRLHEVPR